MTALVDSDKPGPLPELTAGGEDAGERGDRVARVVDQQDVARPAAGHLNRRFGLRYVAGDWPCPAPQYHIACRIGPSARPWSVSA